MRCASTGGYTVGFFSSFFYQSFCVLKSHLFFYGYFAGFPRVSVQGVKSLGGHFAGLCRGIEFYEVKIKKKMVIIFLKENGNTFTLFIIFIVKSLQKEHNSTNLLLWPPICLNKSAITPKWFNSLDTNSKLPSNLKGKNFVSKFPGYCPQNTMAFFSS